MNNYQLIENRLNCFGYMQYTPASKKENKEIRGKRKKYQKQCHFCYFCNLILVNLSTNQLVYLKK